MPFVCPTGYVIPIKRETSDIRGIKIADNSKGIVGLMSSFEEISRTCQTQRQNNVTFYLEVKISFMIMSALHAWIEAHRNKQREMRSLLSSIV
jgi:hypothetical protein